ncbi:MAG: hypothetical protein ABIH49_03660 [archaeon]
MKKVPLQVYYFADSLRPMAHFVLKSEELNFFIPVRAIVDTGSPITLVGNLDLRRMRLSPLQLKKLIGRHKPVNIGGGQVTTKILEKAKLKFGDNLETEMPVNFPISSRENFVQPSLLEVDFLLKTGAKLVFNPSKKEAYFEIDDN